MKLVRLLLIGLTISALTACSKTVQWEEEVLLNTGETIVVKRSLPWELQGGTGNPADIALRPNVDQQIYAFSYRGKDYRYSGGADVRWIAISPTTKNPVLVARPESWAWTRRNVYACTVPFYLQLDPNAGQEKWTWPESIEPWLYNLPANVMATIPRLEDKKQKRYTMSEKHLRDATVRIQSPAAVKIDPLYEAESCYTKKDIERSKQPADWTKK